MSFDLWLVAAHVAVAVVWTGGLTALGIAVLAANDPALREMDTVRRFAAAVRRFDHRVTAPAMAATWAFGSILALRGAWFGEPWLTAKIVVVVALSALHGVLSGGLRRNDAAAAVGALARHTPATVGMAVLAIAGLVIVKPL